MNLAATPFDLPRTAASSSPAVRWTTRAGCPRTRRPGCAPEPLCRTTPCYPRTPTMKGSAHAQQTRRHVRRMPAMGAAVALAAGMLVCLAPAAHAAAGATLPFTSVEAESARPPVPGSVRTTPRAPRLRGVRAPGRAARRRAAGRVHRAAGGRRGERRLQRPDGQSGTLNVYVNGTRLSKTLAVTSKYSYVDTGWIPGSKTHHFYDNARLLLGQNVQAGDRVAFESTGTQVTVDVADFEQVAAAATEPAGSVSVTSKGADPAGRATPPRPSGTPSPRPRGEWSGSRRATTG